MLTLVVAWLLSQSPAAAAQSPVPSASPAVARADTPAPDTSAAFAESYSVRDKIFDDGRTERRFESQIQVKTAAGVTQVSQLAFMFAEGLGDVDYEEVSVIKPDGQRIDAKKSAAVDVSPVLPPNVPVYSDLRVKRLAIPSLAPGDRLHYVAVVREKPVIPGVAYGEFKFGDPRIAGRQVYELETSEPGPAIHVRAGLRAESQVSRASGRVTHRWELPGGPEAPAPDPRAATEPDVMLSSYGSWRQFADGWVGPYRPASSAAVAEKARLLTTGIDDATQRLTALYRFVAQEVRYLGLPLGQGRYRPRPPEETLKTSFGDCKDKHLLLASLAKAVGIEVDPVLVHSARRNLVEEIASPLQFDHVVSVAKVGSREIWLDTTTEVSAFGALPSSVRGKRALRLLMGPGEQRGELLTTPADPPFPTESRALVIGTVDRDGLIKARVRLTTKGDDEAIRLAFKHVARDALRKSVEQYAEEWKEHGRIGEVSNSDPNDVIGPFWFEYEVSWDMGPSIWSKPWELWVPVPKIEIREPPKEEPDRDLELSEPAEQSVSAVFELPEGVEIKAPLAVTAKREFAEYRSSYSVSGQVLRLERVLRRAARKVSPTHFPELEAFRKIIGGDRDQKYRIGGLVKEEAASALELRDRGRKAIDSGDYQAAVAPLKRSAELDPKDRWTWHYLALAHRELRQFSEAHDAVDRILALDPFDDFGQADRGRVLMNEGKAAEAEVAFRKQIDIAPLDQYAHYELGRLLLTLGRYPEARDSFEKAATVNPRNSTYQLYLGCASLLAERRDDGLAALRRAAALGNIERASRRALADLTTGSALSPRQRALLSAELATAHMGALKDLKSVGPVEVRATGAIGASWSELGRLAREGSRSKEAEAYLLASWLLMESPGTALELEALYRQQGAVDRANEFLAAAASLMGSDSVASKMLRDAIGDRGRRDALLGEARERISKARTLSIKAEPGVPRQGAVWLLYGSDATVRASRAADPGASLDDVLLALRGTQHPVPFPPGFAGQILRRAAVACSAAGDCSVILMPTSLEWLQPSPR